MGDHHDLRVTLVGRELSSSGLILRTPQHGIDLLLSSSRPSTLPAREGNSSPAFELRDVQLRYSATAAPVIGGVSTSLAASEFVSIVGPSGCGKSTLLKMLAGLLAPSSGAIARGFDSEAGKIGFVFQHPTLLPWRTAVENLQLPLELGSRQNGEPLGLGESLELLRQVGLKESDSSKRPAELSGGMQMRLSLARALATRPMVLLLDEPFAAVDDLLRMKLQDDVRRIHEQRRLTTILVTHNLQEAVYLSDRVLVMSSAPSRVVGDIRITQSNAPGRSSDFRESSEFHAALQQVSRALFAPVIRPSEEKSSTTEPAS